MTTDTAKPHIVIDIAKAMEQLQANPELGVALMEAFGGPVLAQAQRQIEELCVELETTRAQVAGMRTALEELSVCDLHAGNCGSLEIASKRIRAIARKALSPTPAEKA
jgi:hypothetical protein